ncbi:MAG: M28 family peptidase [Acidobacteriota bacterium]
MHLLAATLSSLLAVPAASSSPAAIPSVRKEAAAKITAEVLRAHVKFLSSDLLEGRGPASRGDRLAQEYIATRLETLGVQPGAPGGGWFQKVPLMEIGSEGAESMTLTAGAKSLTIRRGEDFVARSGTQNPEAQLRDAEVVFVGYGIVAPEYKWDDFKDVDVRGKVLLVMNNDPEKAPNLFAGKTRLRYGRWDYKYAQAAQKGAAGVILIHTTPSAAYPWQVVQTSSSGLRYELPDDGSPRIQMKGWATEDACRKIAALGSKDLDALRAAAESRKFRPVPLGVRVSYAMTNTIRKTESANVIGMIPGSDPQLSKQAVFYTAHHDHLGVKPGIKPGADAIYNGALDNASGVAAVLAIAQAAASLPRAGKRTVYFALVAAEEQNLLGSEYLTRHPPVPSGRIAADINIDGVAIWGKTKDVSEIGLGKSSLDRDIVALAAAQGRSVKADEFPDKGSFYRSDQYSFAKIGVPSAYLKSGTEVIGKPEGWGREQAELFTRTDYHQPSDEYRDSWDLSCAVEDVQLCFYLGAAVADTPAMPEWTKGDEFEAARKAALAEP